MSHTFTHSGCGVTRTVHHGIQVKRGATREDKVNIAQAIATKERLQLLREQIAARMPGIAKEDLDGAVGLRWFQFESRSGAREGNEVVVGVRISVPFGTQVWSNTRF